MIEFEQEHIRCSTRHLKTAAKFYVRANALCMESADGEDNEFFIASCINAGEVRPVALDDASNWRRPSLACVFTFVRMC